MSEKKLTPKQEAFCQEYIKDFNGTQAAIRAGYSENTAKVTASENLTKPDISTKIEELKKSRSERVQIDADWVLTRLGQIDQMDVKDIFNDDWTLKPIGTWPEVWRKTVSGIDVMETNDGIILKKMKWPDKVKNLELIGKHVKVQAFQDKVKNEVSVTHEQFLDELK